METTSSSSSSPETEFSDVIDATEEAFHTLKLKEDEQFMFNKRTSDIEEEEEFFDVLSLDHESGKKMSSEVENMAILNEEMSAEVDNTAIPNAEFIDYASPKVVDPPEDSRLSVLEFLQDKQEEEEEQTHMRESIFEFLQHDKLNEIVEESENYSSDEDSGIQALQKELENDAIERDDRVRRTILNLPEQHVNAKRPLPPPPNASLRRQSSLLRRANPLASFFEGANPDNSEDSDSMISELTEAMTSKTDLTEARLSRLSSIIRDNEDPIESIKMAKRYKPVTVKVKSKQKSEFNSLFLIQELNRSRDATTNSPMMQRTSNIPRNNNNTTSLPVLDVDPSRAIFCLKFSFDGRFLAAAGAEGVIKIWSLMQVDEGETNGGEEVKLDHSSPIRLATIFHSEPVQVLKGHTAEILDCAWSTNNFLLTASMDKTVRLWHHTRSDALGIFQHLDYVTSVAFHPRDPRIFLSGSLDCKLRLWSIQDRNILHWNELPPENFITAVAFSQSGNAAIAGTSGGTALIFHSEGLRYNTQILVRSSRKTSGKKITSIVAVPGQYGNDERILISSNDSRIRMYSLRDKNVLYKYNGHENKSSQIKASLSVDADWVISGSEDCRVYLWNSDGKFQKKSFFSSFRKDHISSYESFKAHSNPVTAAIFAPNCVVNLLKSHQLRPLNSLLPNDGKIIVTSDVTGQIKIFENNSNLIEWLK